MKRAALAFALACLPGCYWTTLDTGATPGPEQSQRAWFALAGGIPLAGARLDDPCPDGLAYVRSGYSATDQALALLRAAALGLLVYQLTDDAADGWTAASVSPFLLDSRTQLWACEARRRRAARDAPDWPDEDARP